MVLMELESIERIKVGNYTFFLKIAPVRSVAEIK